MAVYIVASKCYFFFNLREAMLSDRNSSLLARYAVSNDIYIVTTNMEKRGAFTQGQAVHNSDEDTRSLRNTEDYLPVNTV